MAKNTTPKALAAAIGAAFVASMTATTVVNADQNPFAMKPLASGYQVAEKEGQCGEGKCGSNKDGKKDGSKDGKKEGQCGEGKCGSKK